MDLLIKNMEMPKEGSVVIEIYSDGVWCDYKSSQHHEKAIELPPSRCQWYLEREARRIDEREANT